MPNFIPSGFSTPQLGQCMGIPSGTAVERLGGTRHTSQGAPLIEVCGMRRQYSRWRQESSEKHKTAAGAGVEEGLTDEAWRPARWWVAIVCYPHPSAVP